MAELTQQAIRKAGVADLDAALTAAAAAGDSVDYSSGQFIVVKNGDSGSHVVTIAAPDSTTDTGNLGLLAVADIAVTVAAGDYAFIAVPPGYAQSGAVAWTYDDETSVTVGVFGVNP